MNIWKFSDNIWNRIQGFSSYYALPDSNEDDASMQSNFYESTEVNNHTPLVGGDLMSEIEGRTPTRKHFSDHLVNHFEPFDKSNFLSGIRKSIID